MREPEPRAESTECERALVELVGELECSDYRNSAGVRADQTRAFFTAKALVALLSVLDRPPRWRN